MSNTVYTGEGFMHTGMEGESWAERRSEGTRIIYTVPCKEDDGYSPIWWAQRLVVY